MTIPVVPSAVDREVRWRKTRDGLAERDSEGDDIRVHQGLADTLNGSDHGGRIDRCGVGVPPALGSVGVPPVSGGPFAPRPFPPFKFMPWPESYCVAPPLGRKSRCVGPDDQRRAIGQGVGVRHGQQAA